MKRIAILVIAAALIIPALARADMAKLKPAAVIYTDDKGGELKYPEGVACSEKMLVIADTANGRLLRYSYEIDEVKGGAEIKIPQLSYPIRIQINSKGEIYALDGKQRRIVRLKQEGTFGGYLEIKDLPAPASIVPRSFKIHKETLYILDIQSERVVVADGDGKYIRQLPFPAGYGFFSDLAVGDDGTIYLLDSVTATLHASDGTAFKPLTQSLAEYMEFPVAIVAHKGSLLIGDQNGGGIATIAADGTYLGRQLGIGWKNGLVNYPGQFCIGGKGELFIADRNNSRIQLFEPVR